MNEQGKRIKNEWEFFYNGWKSKLNKSSRSGATVDNLFPDERKSSLDFDLLKKLGLNRDRICDKNGNPDALFFYQLLLPMCDPQQSGIENDPRKGFYTDVTRYSNLYKHQMGIGSTYGHSIPEIQMYEYVRFDGCIVRDGVRGGGDGALYRRWFSGNAHADDYCQEAMPLSRWNQLKRVYKLNNNDKAKGKGEVGYNPTYKYDLIYDVLTSNVRAITKRAELDLTGDETSWGFMGYGEAGTKVVSRIMGKPGISKGGQTVVVSATNRIRPYWYQHRHNKTKRYGVGWTAEGPCEVRSCIDFLDNYVVGKGGDEKKIFSKEPHMTFDNYFSGEVIFQYAGNRKWGLAMTTRRDRQPKAVNSEYMHKKKTDVATVRTKVARFIEPVILVKQQENYEIVLTSFQSTSSCNIMTVNAFDENHNFIEARSRGRGNHRRMYCIENNTARRLYLKTYSRIDSIDHLLKNMKLKYTTWKYWHAPVNHCKALAIATAYDLYLEVCEGKSDPALKLSHPVDSFIFRDILSRQMCNYLPEEQKYPGDENMRLVTVMNRKRKAELKKNTKDSINIPLGDGSDFISFGQYKSIMGRNPVRFCMDLTQFENHLKVMKPHKSRMRCAVCGDFAFKRCGICGVALHHLDIKGVGKGWSCSFQYHDESYLGLCHEDQGLIENGKVWKNEMEQQLAPEQ